MLSPDVTRVTLDPPDLPRRVRRTRQRRGDRIDRGGLRRNGHRHTWRSIWDPRERARPRIPRSLVRRRDRCRTLSNLPRCHGRQQNAPALPLRAVILLPGEFDHEPRGASPERARLHPMLTDDEIDAITDIAIQGSAPLAV